MVLKPNIVTLVHIQTAMVLIDSIEEVVLDIHRNILGFFSVQMLNTE